MSKARHAHSRSQYAWLTRPLRNWTERIECYAERWSGTMGDQRDAAYWYGERATASVMVAALAESGAAVLAEYDCPRDRGFADGPRRGRSDFWFSLQGHDAVVEAKQVWPKTPTALPNACARAHAQAADQLLSGIRGAGLKSQLLSVVFAVPSIDAHRGEPWTEYLDAAKAAVQLESGTASGRDVAWAWSFPEAARELRGLVAPNRIFPGVLLTVREHSRPEP